MHQAYAEWIKANVVGDGYGRCHDRCDAMVKQFPELRHVQGFFYSSVWGRRMHGWCETKDGQIIDPTGRQFPDGTNFPISKSLYDEVRPDEVDRIPTGRCMDCGEDTYRDEAFCNAACAEAYRRYVERD